MELRFRLAAEVIKFYRQDPEERALADLIIHLIGLTLQEAQALSIDELEQLIANAITLNDETPLPPRGKDRRTRKNVNNRKEAEAAVDTYSDSDRLIGVDDGAEGLSERNAGTTDNAGEGE